MKKIQKMCFLALVGLMVGTSCEKTPATPNPQDDCIEGVVIAENYRTTTAIPNDGACTTIVQIKNRNMGETFIGNSNRSYDNCVVIRNISGNLAKLNQKIYFKTFTELDCGFWLANCVPVEICIIADNITTKCEPK